MGLKNISGIELRSKKEFEQYFDVFYFKKNIFFNKNLYQFHSYSVLLKICIIKINNFNYLNIQLNLKNIHRIYKIL